MSGIRKVLETFDIPVDPKRKFTANLPIHLLENEPRRLVAKEMWDTQVCKAINVACRARKSWGVNKHVKRIVFRSAMEKICGFFNLRTENLKVQFRQQQQQDSSRTHRTGKRITYNLHVIRLSDIRANVRNARYVTAEIPERLEEAQGELVGHVDVFSPSSSSPLPCVPVMEIIREEPLSSYHSYDGANRLYPEVSAILPAAVACCEPSSSVAPVANEVVAHAESFEQHDGSGHTVSPLIQAILLPG
mmetsp:Transcript_113977/g.170467  ORF Transcript_113977/g.170467 Transcript_113977/m.170467 type:complete len:247 (-) Transcript_113977:59-799(-)